MNTEKNRRVQLDPRLAKCAEFVRSDTRIADIGTDHGYLPISLLQSGTVKFAAAGDVNAGPLESAMRNAEKYGVAGSMRFVLTDGLHGLSANDADDIIIAGMGGELILRIISEADWLRTPEKHLILQPMTTAAQLRSGLYALGFEIDREEAVYDGRKIYSVLSVYYTGRMPAVDPLQEHMGKIVPNSPYSERYAASVLHNLENKLRGMEHTGENGEALRQMLERIRTLYFEKGRDE